MVPHLQRDGGRLDIQVEYILVIVSGGHLLHLTPVEDRIPKVAREPS